MTLNYFLLFGWLKKVAFVTSGFIFNGKIIVKPKLSPLVLEFIRCKNTNVLYNLLEIMGAAYYGLRKRLSIQKKTVITRAKPRYRLNIKYKKKRISAV